MKYFDSLHRLIFGPPKFPFDPTSPTIDLPVTLTHGDRELSTTMTLDTGSSFVVVTPAIVAHLGLKLTGRTISISTASGTETAAIISLPQITVLGLTLEDCPAIVTQLPESSGTTGLLGLSFLKHYKLTLNFPKHHLTLG